MKKLFLMILLIFTFFISEISAQGISLTREDRLAVLYAPQLLFTTTGEPLIKIGITDQEERIEFSANTPIVVLPIGHGGPEIEFPAETPFTMTIQNGQEGSYSYGVVVAEFGPLEQTQATTTRNNWRSQYENARALQLGSIFAVEGRQFDTRRILIVVGETEERQEAADLALQIEAEQGIETNVHADLITYPGGELTLTGAGITLRHRDLLWIRGSEETVFTVQNVDFDRGTRYEGSENRNYVGALIFTADRQGQLALVNEINAERLLEGVLPAEVYATAPMHALMAQAVAARSELLTDLGSRHLADPFMTCSDQRCQVYRGITYEHTSTSEAVERTRGYVMTDGEQIINAFYSSNNGGFAAANHTTWNVEPRQYLSAHVDVLNPDPAWENGLSTEEEVQAFLDADPEAYANIDTFSSGRFFRWTNSLDSDALNDAVSARYQIGSVINVEILERGLSGRVSRLRITGTRDEVIIERELNVRRAFGGLRSALFTMNFTNASDGIIEEITFNGAGFGHGVGLCQTGAIGAAERGISYDEILNYYYRGATLTSLY